MSGDSRFIAGLPMYDWPEVQGDVDRLWATIVTAARDRGVAVPDRLKRAETLIELWGDPSMILGQVCSLNPVRDGLGETEVIGTIVYEPARGLPDQEPGTYYSVLVARSDDTRCAGLGRDGIGHRSANDSIRRFTGATVAANGTDSQSGYWSLGHFIDDHLVDGPLFDDVIFTAAHRESVRAVADGRADLAAIDVHSWRLAMEHEPASSGLTVIGTTEPTPGVVCVVSWELKQHRAALDAALAEALDSLAGSETAARLHVNGYRSRRLEEFQVVADRVEHAARHPWHR
ncbi:MAG: PhnD/SsuA/transferrin family substrate-binding protein [Ilumatobacter sp.]|uniref:phosphate/phosphite/phosphonate ABC transporter substrate-binding protein n=1 Tax=Ilumatobacter sp. TaxID=1967498 RepID=UPI003C75B43B